MMRLFLLLCLAGLAAPLHSAPIAVTVDDLPLQAAGNRGTAEMTEINRDLLAALEARHIPAIGFVNEGKLETGGRPDPERVAILKQWLETGMALGNHSHSHPDLHRIDIDDYLADIDRGHAIIRPLAERHGSSVVFFRHPFLRTGRTLEIRDAVHRHLHENGYRVAPVTIDNSEWIFAAAYRRASEQADAAMMDRLGRTYIDYMIDKTAFFVRNAHDLFDRDIAQVLLIHVNRLNADWFGRLADRLAKQGHVFVSLEAALEDPAYQSEDTWTGAGGISWLHRWALAGGVEPDFFAGEPRTPQWVLEYAGIGSE